VGFKNDAEADSNYNYLGDQYSPKEKLLMEVAEKYNLIAEFLSGFNEQTRDFLSFLLDKLIPQLTDLD
jgi:hypothetical protein